MSTGIYRNEKTGERVRPVPGSAEHQRLRVSQRFVQEPSDPPLTGDSTDDAAAPTATPDPPATEPKSKQGERRTATATGTAKIKTGGGAS